MTSPDLNQLAAAKMLRKDVPLNEPRVKVRGESTSNGVIVREHVIDQGEFEIEVYESDVAKLEALVETASADDLRRVQAELEYATEEAQKPEGGNPRPYLPSFAAAFREVMKRDMRPLRFVERVAPEKASKKSAA